MPPGGKLELLDTTTFVETPERVRFRYRLAGPGRRAVAWGLDLVLRVVVFLVVAVGLGMLAVLPGAGGVSTGVLLLVAFAIHWLYGVFFETLLSGRTPGKMLLGLRVVSEDGAPARFPDFLLRNLLVAVDVLPSLFGLGVLVMLLDPKMRRIGDMVAGTVVVVEGRERVLQRVAIEPPVTDDERQALPPRVDLSPDELAAIEAWLRRRRLLTPERYEELAALFGPAVSARSGIEADTWSRVLALAYARATGKDR